MSTFTKPVKPQLRGVIRQRLLVNALVDPDEAAARLPAGLAPFRTNGGTVVGCCLLQIGALRPAGFPAAAGRRLRAAAHRIAIDRDGGPAVYVPMRLTDSRVAVAMGGRVFPGVHRRAVLTRCDAPGAVTWTVEDAEFALRVTAIKSARGDRAAETDPVAATCLAATVGLSPDHSGVLEGVCMLPDHRVVQRVEIEELHSEFLDGFTTATPAPSYVMQDVGVTWTRAHVLVRGALTS